MTDARLALERMPTDDALLARFAEEHPSVALVDLPKHRARRARWGRPPAPHAVAGFTWDLRDARAPHWWPQGIDVLPASGARPALIAVSWFSQRGRASRVSLVEPRPDAPRYWHVDLLEPTADGPRPVLAHAGGLAVLHDRLYVAATHDGLLEFRWDTLHEVDGRLALAQTARLRPITPEGARRLRYSFVSLESHGDELGLAVGEWQEEEAGRLARFLVDRSALPTTGGPLDEPHLPGIAAMQGALATADGWFVTASRGAGRAGDLWVGDPATPGPEAPGRMRRLEGELVPGPEDIALWEERGQLWTVSEYPGRRWVYALDAAEVRARTRPASGPAE